MTKAIALVVVVSDLSVSEHDRKRHREVSIYLLVSCLANPTEKGGRWALVVVVAGDSRTSNTDRINKEGISSPLLLSFCFLRSVVVGSVMVAVSSSGGGNKW
jgi:hypothetical protein